MLFYHKLRYSDLVECILMIFSSIIDAKGVPHTTKGHRNLSFVGSSSGPREDGHFGTYSKIEVHCIILLQIECPLHTLNLFHQIYCLSFNVPYSTQELFVTFYTIIGSMSVLSPLIFYCGSQKDLFHLSKHVYSIVNSTQNRVLYLKTSSSTNFLYLSCQFLLLFTTKSLVLLFSRPQVSRLYLIRH